MSELYIECYSGISGDMTVGALLDLGADREALQQVLSTVPAEGFDVKISTVQKSAVNACDFDVILEEDNHDHDMEYLYGEGGDEHHHHHHDHDHDHEHHHHHHDHDHDHEHHHHHDHDHEHHHHDHDHEHHHHDHDHEHHHHHDHEHEHHHHHVHRALKDVYEIIDGTQMTDGARKIAKDIFACVAKAEAEVHGKSVDEVHFHEVGAVDSIVDVISIAVCFDNLREKENITDVIVSDLYEGRGMVRCQHGKLPIPVPAVTSIARSGELRIRIMSDEGEFVTPTGAAAAAVLRTKKELPESFVIRKAGLGAGKRVTNRAGFLRMMLIEK